jgi:hypothetical protein
MKRPAGEKLQGGFRQVIRGFLRHPALHMAALGALAFGIYFLLFAGSQTDENVITLTEGDLDDLVAKWQMTFRREPTLREVTSLIENHIREEVLFREAMRMGLDQDDIVIRRRLAQKMDFLSQDLAAMVEPTDSAVIEYYRTNAETYRIPPQVTFSHIYFNADARGILDAQERAEAAKYELGSARRPPRRAPERGDRFMLGYDFSDATPQDVVSLFGASEIADSIFVIETGIWHGPLASGYGLHLVYVEKRTEPRLPPFEEVEQDVRIDHLNELRKRTNDALYAGLRGSYQVVLDEGLKSKMGRDAWQKLQED